MLELQVSRGNCPVQQNPNNKKKENKKKHQTKDPTPLSTNP